MDSAAVVRVRPGYREVRDTRPSLSPSRPGMAGICALRPSPVAASDHCKAGAAAGIAALLAAVIPGNPSWRRQAAAEFLKEGLHAVAEWWLENPGPSREEIVDVVTGLVFSGQSMKGLEGSMLRRP
jgi:hypothetical protein